MNHPVIQTNRLSFRYGNQLVLDNLNLIVPAGSIFGFLGPNGSGKTTTIRILLGLSKAPTGAVRLFGQDIRHDRLSILGRVGALIETPALYPHLSGYENMELARIARGGKKENVDLALLRVGLTNEAIRKVRTYSLGMRQRLGIALALLGDPDLLILDEPTNGLDPAGVREIRTLLMDLSTIHGKTIFVSSHLLSEMEKFISHVAILDQGCLLFQGAMHQLKEQHTEVARQTANPAAPTVSDLEDIFLTLTQHLR